MNRLVKRLLALFIPPVVALNSMLRSLSAAGHHLQYLLQWRFASRMPDSFDQHIDLHWKWGVTHNPMSWERGIFGLLAMNPGCRLLDLCCGEGFYAQRFYSCRAGEIVAMDYDRRAIAKAQRQFAASNITYLCGDIRTEMPQGPFDNVSWNAGIEYFTPSEINNILGNIKNRLAPEGVLSGYSILMSDSTVPLDGQKYAAGSREAQGELLGRFFRNVTILRTRFADRFQDRTNHYFFASDGPLPFDENWPNIKRWTNVPGSP